MRLDQLQVGQKVYDKETGQEVEVTGKGFGTVLVRYDVPGEQPVEVSASPNELMSAPEYPEMVINVYRQSRWQEFGRVPGRLFSTATEAQRDPDFNKVIAQVVVCSNGTTYMAKVG